MSVPGSIASQMVEFHRFGEPQAILTPSSRYIRTTGWDGLAVETPPLGTAMLSHEQFLRNLTLLRYTGRVTPEQVNEAQTVLAERARDLLPLPEALDDRLLQIDIVTNAAELWAYPFEACFAIDDSWLASVDRGLILTRRIRGAFSEEALPWPDMPRVLFVHAPVTEDLEEKLVEAHVHALKTALGPWGGADGILIVKEVLSAEALTRANEEYRPSYVHILAHGAPTEPDPLLLQKTEWGLRLGYEGEYGIRADDIAAALEPRKDRPAPLVVTLAACDSANQGQPELSARSLVQELHHRGIPVVIGSQLPLTKHGSKVLARSFYEALLRGEDVRVALHAARVSLKQQEKAEHDWLSLVGYVRLPPEAYAAHLAEFRLRAELGMLKALQNRADRLLNENGTLEDFNELEKLIRHRIESLGQLQASRSNSVLADERRGLMASARKRLAELLFRRATRHAGRRDDDIEDSRKALNESLEHYRDAWRSNIHNHWLGIQHLGLMAVLRGRLERPGDWDTVVRAAELTRDAEPLSNGRKDFWSCGTLAEAWLLAPIAGKESNMDAARDAIELLRERAKGDKNEVFALESTKRQLGRYVDWWTRANGFFPGREDLSKDAQQLLRGFD